MIDPSPPCLPNIERAVLGAMLISDEAIAKAIELINDEVFYTPANQILFKALVDMYSSNIPIDALTVSEHLFQTKQLDNVGGDVTISVFMSEATTSANIEYHCQLIKEKATLRKLLSLSNTLQTSCYEQKYKSSAICDALMNHLFTIKNAEKNKHYSTMLEMTLEAHEEIMKRIEAKGELYGITTGFDRFDKMTDGWQDGDLIIVAALPSVGKTALSLNFARNAAYKDYPVAIFSMEMSKSQLGKRFIAIESRLDVRRKDFIQAEYTALSDASNRQSRLPIYIDDSSSLTHPALYAKMKTIKNEHDVKLIIVDYLQLMSGFNRSESRRLQIEDITRNMKGYAKELSVPIILLSQLNRESEKQNRKPRLSDLKEAGGIEADADVVIFIHETKPDIIIKMLSKLGKDIDEDETKNIVEIIIGKQRNGPTGSFFLMRHSEYTRFENLCY